MLSEELNTTDIEKIDFDSDEIVSEFERIEEENTEIIRQSKLGVDNLMFTI